MFTSLFVAYVFFVRETFSEALPVVPSALFWWNVHAVTAPAYAVFLSPLFALLIRKGVSGQREFLADADAALLTRDPEALALALVKIDVAGGHLPVTEGSVHLYFAAPRETSLLHQIFPSHPPLASRIELLMRMGSGIAPSALKAAREAGEKFRHAQGDRVEFEAAPQSDPEEVDFDARQHDPGEMPPQVEPDHEAPGWVEDAFTPIYERPDGWSRVVARIPQDTRVTPVGSEGNFIRVITKDNVTGYVASSARLPGLKLAQR